MALCKNLDLRELSAERIFEELKKLLLKADKPSLAESVEGLSYSTEFERETYEMLRARNLRQLCYAAAAEASQCLVMDPATNSPIMIVAFGP